MTEEMKAIIAVLVHGGGKRESDFNEWDGYERFKQQLRQRFGRMESADYDAAIKQYSETWLRITERTDDR